MFLKITVSNFNFKTKKKVNRISLRIQMKVNLKIKRAKSNLKCNKKKYNRSLKIIRKTSTFH